MDKAISCAALVHRQQDTGSYAPVGFGNGDIRWASGESLASGSLTAYSSRGRIDGKLAYDDPQAAIFGRKSLHAGLSFMRGGLGGEWKGRRMDGPWRLILSGSL